MDKFTRRDFLRTFGAGVAGLSVTGVLSRNRLLFGNTPFDEKDIKDLKSDNSYQVCVVGSGPAGALLATSLAKKGIKTLVLESGFNPYDNTPKPGFGKLDAYSSLGELDYPLAATRFRGLGGTSNIWGGICPRFVPRDFELNAYTPPDAPWPITYDDIEPYYQYAEKEMRVSGGGSNIYSPPRSKEYPFEPDSKGDISDLEEFLDEVGLVVEYTPLAWSIKSNGPMSIMESHMPKIESEPLITLVKGATVTQVIMERDGQVAGLETRTLDNEVKEIRAQSYVLACGGIETPRLMLLSKSSDFPHGVGNHNDLVGRFFMEHPEVAQIRGRAKEGDSSLLKRANKRAISYQFESDFKSRGLGNIVLLFDYWGIQLRDLNLKSPFKSIGDMIDAHSRPTLVFRAIMEMEPSPLNRVTLDYDNKDYFGNPGAGLSIKLTEKDEETMLQSNKLLKILAEKLKLEDIEEHAGILDWGHHHIGTCRMGNDPKTSVVDKNLKVHGTKNLFVSGSSVFVTSGAAMPTLTLSALAIRLADHLSRTKDQRNIKESAKVITG